MPCYFPLQAFRARHMTKNGKRAITFDVRESDSSEILFLPCSRCIGCRLERSRQWALRCMLEASEHIRNCFITLTFNDENLPKDNSLDVRYFQNFMKKLRKKYGNGIRFFHCGEYGDKYGRPHYHAILFNHDFDDKVLWKNSGQFPLYRSSALEKLWPYGYSSIGNVTFESAAYVARYVMKKVTGDGAWTHYLDVETGVIKKPEYTTMSRKPGIASNWFSRFSSDVYPHDFMFLRGRKMKPPKYFDRMFESKFPDLFEELKAKRLEDSLVLEAQVVEMFPDPHLRSMHLDVKRRHKELSIKRLVRTVD